MKEYFCLIDAMKVLGISKATCYRYLSSGMPYIEERGHRYVNIEECEQWINSNVRSSRITKRVIMR